MVRRRKARSKTMPVHYHDYEKYKFWLGLCIFIFGLILWYTNNWGISFMAIGILTFLKGLIMK